MMVLNRFTPKLLALKCPPHQTDRFEPVSEKSLVPIDIG
jgi:hypothetical protein